MNIKEKIQSSCVHQWEVAEKLNISEFTLSRWLRRPENLCVTKIKEIEKVINEIRSGYR